MTIKLTDIELGDRGRVHYHGIEELAQSIEDNGLIQPIVVEASTGTRTVADGIDDGQQELYFSYVLVAGGRRLHALKHIGVEELHHGVSSEPGRYGFVLKSESQEFSSDLSRVMAELAENLDRHNLDWRDETRLIVRAYRLAKREAATRGETVIMRDFGATLGVTYADLQASAAIVADLDANPDRYKECVSCRGAYALLLKETANEINKLAAAKSISTTPLYPAQAQPSLSEVKVVSSEPKTEITEINLSQSFFNQDGLDFLASLPDGTLDHVICDPDYAIEVDVLNSNMFCAADGVIQTSITESLSDLRRLCFESFRATKDGAFLIMWYDLDHHEKLQGFAKSAGWLVQNWPLIWEKTDYRSNGAPQANFCKNMEYAMICRKPGATLAKVQMSSIHRCGNERVVKELSHPFAKPYALWHWLFQAVAIKGQLVCDPFAGSGSMPIAATQWGLRAVGCEKNPIHYNTLLGNLQTAYRKLVPGDVKFV